jgi:branched-chain amino acid transport system ATP-binding protein
MRESSKPISEVTAMLEVSDLDVFYGDRQALYDVTLRADQGEFLAIVGSNGAGKSTLIRTISGLLAPRGGQIKFKGESIAGLLPHEVTKKGIVQVPEGRRLFVNMTVEENLEMGAYLHEARAKKQENLQRVFDLFPILKERRRQTAATLSGGEQQMVAIGRALMSDPSILLIDEFSLGLAPVLTEKLFSVITKLNAAGLTVLMVEQNVHLALEAAKRAYVLENGRIVLEGSNLLDTDLVRKSYLGM